MPYKCPRPKGHRKYHGALATLHRTEDLAIERGLVTKESLEVTQGAVTRMLAYVWDNLDNIYLPNRKEMLSACIDLEDLPREIEVQYKGLSSYFGRYHHRQRLIKLNNKRGHYGNTIDVSLHELSHGVVRALEPMKVRPNIMGFQWRAAATHGPEFKAIYQHLVEAF